MAAIDLNCDMGEGSGNLRSLFATDEAIMPFISSANVACAYHAGDEKIMNRTIELALQHQVAIGAHPSFFDRENFGRREMNLPAAKIYDIIILQLRSLEKIAKQHSTALHHVKPHGALYNMSAKYPHIAEAIAQAVRDFDDSLILFGLSGSHSVKKAQALGLRVANEVFADRTYQDDGSLTPRSEANSMIVDISTSVRQVLKMIQEKLVVSVYMKNVPIIADTICVHSDGEHAIEFASAIRQSLNRYNIDVKAI